MKTSSSKRSHPHILFLRRIYPQWMAFLMTIENDWRKL